MDEQDGTLTQAEEELTYYQWVQDSTLSDQDLNKYCPLAQHRRRSKSRYVMGTLDLLPLETLHIVLDQLDLRSLMSLQLVNRRAFDIIAAMPNLKAIMQHCADTLRGILAVETAPFITCQLLFNTLSSATCETCSDFGGYLYILTCTRVCYRCFTHNPRYLPILRSDARRQFGLSANEIKRLPQMKSIPGRYTLLNKIRKGRLILVDPTAARQAGLVIHGSISAMENKVAKLTAQKMAAYQTRVSCTTRNGRGPQLRAPREEAPRDGYEYNPKRFMAIVPVPFIDTRNKRAQWGFQCLGCRNKVEDSRHFKRQFLASGFRHHLRQCGEIVNGEHIGSVC